MKKCSASLAVREMQNCVVSLFHLSQNGFHQENKNQEMLVRTQVKESFPLLVVMLIHPATIKISMEMCQKY
jgi:hypothetical protein